VTEDVSLSHSFSEYGSFVLYAAGCVSDEAVSVAVSVVAVAVSVVAVAVAGAVDVAVSVAVSVVAVAVAVCVEGVAVSVVAVSVTVAVAAISAVATVAVSSNACYGTVSVAIETCFSVASVTEVSGVSAAECGAVGDTVITDAEVFRGLSSKAAVVVHITGLKATIGAICAVGCVDTLSGIDLAISIIAKAMGVSNTVMSVSDT